MRTQLSRRLMRASALAQLLGVSTSHIGKLRRLGEGPPAVRVGARILYDPADVEAWVQAQKARVRAG